jgi:hypothetical protein
MQRVQAARNDYGRFVSAFQTLKSKPSAQEPARTQPDLLIEAEPRPFFGLGVFGRGYIREEKIRQNK